MARRISGQSVVFAAIAAAVLAQSPALTISADSLRTDLKYLASDELEGRSTPSRGLDLAADYIAAQFKRAGLEPAAGGTYFQTASLEEFGAQAARFQKSLPPDAPTTMRNVAGILRGSDPTLRDTYVILSAHYDHLGLVAAGEDHVMNGANDDASGTVSVIEVARALAALPQHPKRSVLFITFFGEERGLLGSRYYGQHPLVPPQKTIAHLNLEQVGRTDASEGTKIKTANLTGFDFSDVSTILTEAAVPAGVRILKDEVSSDRFFARSDNQALADLGIPAHTLSVAYEFPDYHKVSDEWDKIDYANMADIDRAVALGVLRLASDAPPPQWNANYAPAARYVEAAKRLHAAE